ncbi:MAG: adenine deaminase [Phycisphaerales bacterium]|nr:adenine deaminase [Phycisphaerales bacterium]NNM27771.1 adenine deaminase [Phycisphaerales bacterium]
MPDDPHPLLRRRIAVARGEMPGDVCLRGGRVVNVFNERIADADVLVADGMIAAVGGPFEAAETIDVAGALVTPGLIDAHMHVESTLLTPAALARVIAPRGTAAIIADPHEIGNVLGVRGIELMLEISVGLPVDCFYMASSCVPASPFENPGATLHAEAIARLLDHERVLGLAEMMNFPGVFAGDAEVLEKIRATLARGRVVDGHAPGVLGRDLDAYAAAGIRSDHECTTAVEAIARADRGMLVQVREGSMARNLDALLPAIVAGALGDWCLCTDDVLPEDLQRDGHLDGLLRRVVAAGVPVATAVRHATLVPARHYGLRDRGAVSPGFRADLAVFSGERDFRPQLVLHAGRVVGRDGAYAGDDPLPSVAVENTVHLGPLDAARFVLDADDTPHPVIRVFPDQIVTERDVRSVPHADGRWQFDPATDLALVACIQRHRPSGAMGLGLATGFGFTRHGAIGSSVGHDAHNLMIAGTQGEDMVAAARAIADDGGGFVVVQDGVVTARLPLPLAGLMATEPVEVVRRQLQAIDAAARALGCPLPSPFGTLSFLPLTVIPKLRITDAGLFDVEAFRLVGA